MLAIYALKLNCQNEREQHSAVYDLLYRILETDYGYPKSKIKLCKTNSGKPYCEDLPLEFSLCHTDGLLLVAISDVPCGVDAEKSDRVISSGVARRFLKQDTATVSDWTRYESIAKMYGCGIPYRAEDFHDLTCYTHIYNDVIGYTVCCASEIDSFPQRIILL